MIQIDIFVGSMLPYIATSIVWGEMRITTSILSSSWVEVNMVAFRDMIQITLQKKGKNLSRLQT
jgi:hypothetical protein